jgi:hypothetical protein
LDSKIFKLECHKEFEHLEGRILERGRILEKKGASSKKQLKLPPVFFSELPFKLANIIRPQGGRRHSGTTMKRLAVGPEGDEWYSAYTDENFLTYAPDGAPREEMEQALAVFVNMTRERQKEVMRSMQDYVFGITGLHLDSAPRLGGCDWRWRISDRQRRIGIPTTSSRVQIKRGTLSFYAPEYALLPLRLRLRPRPRHRLHPRPKRKRRLLRAKRRAWMWKRYPAWKKLAEKNSRSVKRMMLLWSCRRARTRNFRKLRWNL